MKKSITWLLLVILLVGVMAIPSQAASRGDTGSFTVSIPSAMEGTSFGLSFSYNSAAIELTSGSWSVSGTLMSSVDINTGKGVAAFGGATTLSGSIATIGYRIKADAPFGNYPVTCTVTANPSGATQTVTLGTVSVVCNHNFGGWTNKDANNHAKTCSICNVQDTQAHTWNSGTITKNATCKEEGVKTYTCTVCSATKTETIAKTTTHTYGAFTKTNDTQHSHTCSVCNNVETVNHTWNSGTVTKAATCKEDGVKTFTCTGCSATKTESITKTTTHTWGNYANTSDSYHARTCSVCGKTDTANHTWNSGTVTKAATCKEDGVKTFACTVCSGTKTESITKTTTHTWGAFTKTNDSQHSRTCTVCGQNESANHSFDSGKVTKAATCKEEGEKTFTCTGCKTTKTESIAILTTHTYGAWTNKDESQHVKECKVCGKTETANHSFATKWSTNGSEHWHACTDCGAKKDSAAHTPGAAPTETTAQLCTVCNYTIKPALGHKHTWSSEWTVENGVHYHACAGCSEHSDEAKHDFENDCDPDCGICGFTRETQHNFSIEYKCDETGHWFECSACGEVKDKEAHSAGPEATETSAQTCTICGYEIAPKLEPAETTEETEVETTEAPVSTEGDNQNTKGGAGWIPFVIGGVAAVAVAAVVIFILLGKKKKKDEE